MSSLLKRNDLVYPELISYKIVGCAFEVFKELGGGHRESVYQKAMKVVFEKRDIKYKEQIYYPVIFQNKIIERNFFDFEIEEKIIVELKKNFNFSKGHIDQVVNYLQVSKLKLAILINFGKEGATYKRIVNII